MIYFGIDPGTATTGYGVVEVQGTTRVHIAHGVIKTPHGMPPEERLRQLHKALHTLYRKYEPDVLSMEELFFSKNVKTAISVAQAQGVILLSVAENGYPLHRFTPNQVKQTVTQNGNATKRDVQKMVRMILAMPEIPRPDDAADALALAICATQAPRKHLALSRR